MMAEVAEPLVDAMVAGGVRVLFFASGSDVMVFQEEIARREAHGLPAPRLVPVLHETVGLNAAMGFAMAGGGVAAVAAHVDVGTLNMGAAWHTLRRCGEPVLILAGSPPTSEPGVRRGGRDHPVYWLQEPVDQRTLFRPYLKWDWRLSSFDNPGLVVSRALQIARSEPSGAAMVTLPRDVVMGQAPDLPYPDTGRLGLPAPTHPDPEAISRLARLIADADCPMIVTGASGRDPRTVPLLTELVELAGAWVTESGWRERLNISSRHPMLATGPALGAADLVLVVDRHIPWVPDGGPDAPPEDATVAWLGRDVLVADVPIVEHPADLRIPCTTGNGLAALVAALRDAHTPVTRRRAQARLAEGRRRRAALDTRQDAEAIAAPGSPVDPRRVAYELGLLLGDDAILLDEAVSNAPHVRAHHRGGRPGSFFAQSGSAGGWGSGAALGAKLAAPERDIVLASGDGFYWFGSPGAALWTARHAGAPYLAVVFVNGRYSTGTVQAGHFYPGGYAEAAGFPGGVFDPPPDYAAEAAAAGGWGRYIDDADQVAQALREGLARTREGVPAVVAVRVR
ncbi:thiamine pyrophosphate-binding protein [Acrocarpospora macrocephala]|uniref:Thiamine pyrophosphate protein n=2 Tax=Acrocarpospora macrocephala TaxID=150177 RepID=A0A5M3WV12_9ACTN|nr:thiamine pyrophosphate protein [Acrocarpospora macrocephala]